MNEPVNEEWWDELSRSLAIYRRRAEIRDYRSPTPLIITLDVMSKEEELTLKMIVGLIEALR